MTSLRFFVFVCSMLFALCGIGIKTTLADTLDDALRTSLENSLEIAAARQKWLSTREAIQTNTSTSDLKAILSASGNQSYTENPSSGGDKHSQYSSGSLNLTKDLYDGGQTKANLKSAQIELRQATANYLATEQKFILSVIEKYLMVLKSRRNAALTKLDLRRLEAHVNASRIRVEAGAVTPTRFAEAEARYARAKSNALVAQTEMQNAEDSYKSLTGLNAGKLELPLLPNNLPLKIEVAEKMAGSFHPKVRATAAAERVAEQSFDRLKASVSPTISLSLSATSKNSSGTVIDSDVFSGSLVFSTPILSSNSTRAKARNLVAVQRYAKYARREALRTVRVAARVAFRDQQTAKINLEAVQRELAASKLVAAGVTSEARFGKKTTLDILDAEQDVSDAELRLVKAEHNVRIAAYQLKAAIGSLTADDMGMRDVLGALEDTPAPVDPFSSSFPFARQKTE